MSKTLTPREAAVAMVGEGAADALLLEATEGIGRCADAGMAVAWSRVAMLVTPSRDRRLAVVSDGVACVATRSDMGKLLGRTTVKALRAWCGIGTRPDCGCVPCPFCALPVMETACEACGKTGRLRWQEGSEEWMENRKVVQACRVCSGTGKGRRRVDTALLYGQLIDRALLGAWLTAAPMLTGAVEVWRHESMFTLVCKRGRLVIMGLKMVTEAECTRSFGGAP